MFGVRETNASSKYIYVSKVSLEGLLSGHVHEAHVWPSPASKPAFEDSISTCTDYGEWVAIRLPPPKNTEQPVKEKTMIEHVWHEFGSPMYHPGAGHTTPQSNSPTWHDYLGGPNA